MFNGSDRRFGSSTSKSKSVAMKLVCYDSVCVYISRERELGLCAFKSTEAPVLPTCFRCWDFRMNDRLR